MKFNPALVGAAFALAAATPSQAAYIQSGSIAMTLVGSASVDLGHEPGFNIVNFGDSAFTVDYGATGSLANADEAFGQLVNGFGFYNNSTVEQSFGLEIVKFVDVGINPYVFSADTMHTSAFVISNPHVGVSTITIEFDGNLNYFIGDGTDPVYDWTPASMTLSLTSTNLQDWTTSATLSVTPPETIRTAVPEPASWALMLGGFGLVGGALRARRQEAAITFA